MTTYETRSPVVLKMPEALKAPSAEGLLPRSLKPLVRSVDAWLQREQQTPTVYRLEEVGYAMERS